MKKLITTLITVALMATSLTSFGRTVAELAGVINTTRQELTTANAGSTDMRSWDAESKDTIATLYEEQFDAAVAETNLNSMINSMYYVASLDETRGRVLFDQIDRAIVFTPSVDVYRVASYYHRMKNTFKSSITTTEAQYVYDNTIMVGNNQLYIDALKMLNIPASEALLSLGNITLWEDFHQVLFDEAMHTLVNGEWREFCTTLFDRIMPVEENLEIKTLLKRIKEGQ